jgi:hypothetical protein
MHRFVLCIVLYTACSGEPAPVDAGVPACADVCPDAQLCTSAGVCYCPPPDGERCEGETMQTYNCKQCGMQTIRPAAVVGSEVFCTMKCYEDAATTPASAVEMPWQPGDDERLEGSTIIGRARVTQGHAGFDALIVDGYAPGPIAVYYDKRTHDFVTCPVRMKREG